MTRAVVVKVVEFDERLYVGSGVVNRWVQRVTFNFQQNAKREAPVNKRANTGHGSPGGLRAGITANVRHRTAKTLVGDVVSTAPYSKYVLGGTAAQGRRYIYSNAGWANKAEVDLIARRVARGGRAGEGTQGYYMRLPKNAVAGGNRVFHLRVHGQRANNFLVRGYNATARTHRALKPMAPKFVYRA